ncbi:TIGR00269 family protein [Candidatus Bathyarchaeota archaeon]|nr:TIGR00269 family protein [Candidatus Bathyarchaeota archaeon]
MKRTINRFNMFEYDNRIAVGVSGGKDSLTLLEILWEIEKEQAKSELVAICIDEGIEGYRDEALGIARKFCKKINIEMHVKSFQELFGETMDDIAVRERELGTCSYCGVLRRKALNQSAIDIGADRLATGHNLDDMAQSVLLNILRGDIQRIEAFEPGGKELESYVRRVKPICEIPERETTFYAYINELDFQNIPCPYASEAMRSDVRGFLNRMEVKRPGTKYAVYQTGVKLNTGEEEQLPIKTCQICNSPTTGKICRACELTRNQ